MTNPLESPLQAYYAQARETLAARPAIRAELLKLGVASVTAEYDGVGDSGQIDEIRYFDGADPAQPVDVDGPTQERVEALLYALLVLRHDGWETDDGACGSFHWDVAGETLEHEHHERYTAHETSLYHGFGSFDGDQG